MGEVAKGLPSDAAVRVVELARRIRQRRSLRQGLRTGPPGPRSRSGRRHHVIAQFPPTLTNSHRQERTYAQAEKLSLEIKRLIKASRDRSLALQVRRSSATRATSAPPTPDRCAPVLADFEIAVPRKRHLTWNNHLDRP